MNNLSALESLRARLLTTAARISRRPYASVAGVGAAAVFMVLSPHSGNAFNLYDGSNYGNDIEINLTTTVSYSGIYRVNSPSAILAGPTNANGNDGDSNFRSGIASNLFEAVPVLDIEDGADYGAHFSGQLYLNTPYFGTNKNDQPGTLNALYTGKSTDFTSATRNVNGENAQLLDAFVYGSHDFEDGQSVQLKLGRQTLFWGQSLYFPENGISAGQAPINVITAEDTLNAQAQQVFMPVPQVVLTYQPIAGLTFQAYYQFEWQHDFFQGAGAYFSSADYIDKGGQSVIVGNAPGVGNEYFLRGNDIDPPNNNGQFGVSVQKQFSDLDAGLFGLRYDSKTYAVYGYPGEGAGAVVRGGTSVGTYRIVYPRDIWIEGASFSTTVIDANVAGEISARQHMNLIPGGFGVSSGEPGNANSNPLYPVGDTLMAQVSSIYVSPGIPFDPGGVSVSGEVAMNHVLSITENRSALAPGLQGTAAAFDVVITPSYYDVLPSLNLTFPIGLTYNFLGRSEVEGSMYHGVGSFNAGITATYKVNWIASLAYQDYLGAPNVTYNATADRGYVSLNLQHSF